MPPCGMASLDGNVSAIAYLLAGLGGRAVDANAVNLDVNAPLSQLGKGTSTHMYASKLSDSTSPTPIKLL